MEEATTSQIFSFSGSIPGHYDRFSGPMFFEPYAVEVSNRIDPSNVRVALELASGTGRVTRHLRNVLPVSTRLIASDISPDMMAVAKDKLKEENIEWREIDAQQLPFEDSSIDLVVCCFGYMFVADKAKAFSEAFRVLKPGRTFLFTTWDRLESIGASHAYRKIAKKYLPDPLPVTFNLPFAMHDESEIFQLLKNAGFSKISIEKLEKQSISPTAKDATEGLTQGGIIYEEIMKSNPGAMEEIKTLVEKELSETYGNAPMVAPMSALICQGWKF